MKRERRLLSTCDSGIFWWQSAAAVQKWPVNDNSVAKLTTAFVATRPERRGGQKVTPRTKTEPKGRLLETTIT